MTTYDFLKDFGLPTMTFVVVVYLIPISRAIADLRLKIVEIKGTQIKLEGDLEHIENNYKQGIEHLDQKVDKVDTRLDEMNADIKELLKLAYGRRKGDEPFC